MRLHLSCLLFLLLSTSTLAMSPTGDGGDGGGGGGGDGGGVWGTALDADGGPAGLKTIVANDGWRCECWNSTEGERMLDCQCAGIGVADAPLELHMDNIQSLTLTNTGMHIFRRETLQPYKNSLRDLTVTNMPNFKRVEAGSFRNLKQLRSIYISEAPELRTLPLGMFEDLSTNFRSLRVLRTGLEHIPDMTGLGHDNIMHMIDLESNKIRLVKSNSIRLKAEQFILDYNAIEAVEAWAFNGSEIGKLSLKGNRGLSRLSHEAFHGLRSLRELDLSQTAITQLPTGGLQDLDVLRITDTKSLKVIPSVYSFRDLREAWLTYSFHCCAFKFPARHDPHKFIQHQTLLAKIEEQCKNDYINNYTGQGRAGRPPVRRKRWSVPSSVQREDRLPAGYHFDDDPGEGGFGAIVTPQVDFELRDQPPERDVGSDGGDDDDAVALRVSFLDHGVFHQTTDTLAPWRLHAICGNLTVSTPHVHCTPLPDALNPCEDIMGYDWLRVCVWFVVITAMVGNLAVLVVLLSTMFDLTVPKFLMCHLAFADLCMGAYLLILAAMDLHSSGTYFNYAFDWQIGSGCQVAGFLTVFASQLSIYTLTILTLERWFAITYAIYLNRRLKLRQAGQIMAAGWLYSITMAALPLFGVSSYSTTSICLPMGTEDAQGVAYLVCLLLVNGLAFVVICVCYAQIYLSLGHETRHCAAHGEMTVAKKMALLVFTDFACWAPIAFFGLTAVAGYPLIDVTRSKILLVFFYPLNSCANPYLYAILTAQYRKDFFSLLARYGLFKKTAQQYKMTYSMPTTNSPYPLLPRTGPGSFSAASTGRPHGEQEEAMV